MTIDWVVNKENWTHAFHNNILIKTKSTAARNIRTRLADSIYIAAKLKFDVQSAYYGMSSKMFRTPVKNEFISAVNIILVLIMKKLISEMC